MRLYSHSFRIMFQSPSTNSSRLNSQIMSRRKASKKFRLPSPNSVPRDQFLASESKVQEIEAKFSNYVPREELALAETKAQELESRLSDSVPKVLYDELNAQMALVSLKAQEIQATAVEIATENSIPVSTPEPITEAPKIEVPYSAPVETTQVFVQSVAPIEAVESFVEPQIETVQTVVEPQIESVPTVNAELNAEVVAAVTPEVIEQLTPQVEQVQVQANGDVQLTLEGAIVEQAPIVESIVTAVENSAPEISAAEIPDPVASQAQIETQPTLIPEEPVLETGVPDISASKRWVRGVVLYAGTEIIPFAANLHGLPISHLWEAHKRERGSN